MITRFFLSATTGIAVTTGLLFLMQYLISAGEEIIMEPRLRHDLVFIHEKQDEVITVNPNVPKRFDKPRTPPRTDIDQPTRIGGDGFKIPGPPKPGPADGTTLTGPRSSDGPLIALIKVAPQYPRIAAAKGLEGSVLVQFDVTTMGTVENVVVVESSNKIFDKAAIAAAYRFKYKPRIVDGVPYETKGLRNRFRFEMEE